MSSELQHDASTEYGENRHVMTVLGPVPPAALGHTQTHEHLLSDLSVIIGRTSLGSVDPLPVEPGAPIPDELPASVRGLVNAPVTPENYDWIRRNVVNVDNLQLHDEAEAVDEMRLYAAAGGGAIVDSTVIGLGRDPEGLARISRATGVHVIMGSGFYTRDYHPAGLAVQTAETIGDYIVSDFTDGYRDTGIRPGMIGEIGLSSPIHPRERVVLEGAARAQVATGAALQIHPGRHPSSPLEAVRVVEEAGGDPTRVVMAHIDRTLTDVQDMVELARTGCYLEFDLFGQESSYYALSDVDRPNDADRIAALSALSDSGFGDKLVIAQDICQKVYRRKYGGPGYTHILQNVLPVMRRKGWSNDDIARVVRRNPAELLAIERSAR